MRVLVFSDIHSDLRRLGELMASDADAYIAAGDMVTWGKGLDKAGAVMSSKRDRVYVMPGNHESEKDVDALCERFGFHNLHGQVVQMGRFQVAGLGYSSPTPFDTPGEYSEAEIAVRLQKFAGLKPMMLICHCPPKNTELDKAGPGKHFGSESVAMFLEREQPEWFFCGHIHEAEGVDVQIGSTRAVNVGKRGFLLELG